MFRGGGRFENLASDWLFWVSDSWACLVSDSGILVSNSILSSDSQFLIRGVLYLIPVF